MDFSRFGNSGGGFFTDGNRFDSPTQTKKANFTRKTQNVFPVLIQQIHNCKDEDFKVFNMTAQMVHIVGVLKEQETESTKIVYVVEDHTGSIKVVYWQENSGDEPNSDLPAVKEGSYVSVYGIVRKHENNKSIMMMTMQPVDDLNILNTHLLEVIFAGSKAKLSSDKVTTAAIPENNPGLQFSNAMNIGQDSNNKLSEIQDKICKIIQTCRDEIGLTKKEIMEKFPLNQHKLVSEQINFLAMEGHIFSTVDEDHFTLTAT